MGWMQELSSGAQSVFSKGGGGEPMEPGSHLAEREHRRKVGGEREVLEISPLLGDLIARGSLWIFVYFLTVRDISYYMPIIYIYIYVYTVHVYLSFSFFNRTPREQGNENGYKYY